MSRILWEPNPGPQTVFLASTARELLYGGAAAGGKTDALVAQALRFVDHPKHRAILLRRTRPQLQEVIDRTMELYPQIVPGIKWNERESRWIGPAGSVIQMGYAEHDDDIRAFKSFEYNLVAFDELTSFTEFQYTFMFSRNRTKSPDLPVWMRAATNPGDIGHQWVFNRFVRNRLAFKVYREEIDVPGLKHTLSITRQFIPARVWDNPKLPNADEYIAGLMQMGDEGQMYLYGTWTGLGGAMFRQIPATIPARLLSAANYYVVRAMDYGLVDPTSIHWLAVYPEYSLVDVVGELHVSELSLDSIADQIKRKEAEIGLKKPVYSVGDPKMFAREGTSMQSIASILASKGLWFEKANNDRVVGWAQVLRYIHQNQLRLWDQACPVLLQTLPMLQRDGRKPNDIKPGQNDHAADSLRYGLMAVRDYQSSPKKEAEAENTANRDTVFDQKIAELLGKKGNNYEGLGQWD